MFRLVSGASRALAASSAAVRPCVCRAAPPFTARPLSTAVLPSSPTPLQRLLAARAAPSLLFAPTAAASSPAGQTRGFKMPRSMRKVASPVARNGGKGKTARKHSARKVRQTPAWSDRLARGTDERRADRPSGHVCVAARSTEPFPAPTEHPIPCNNLVHPVNSRPLTLSRSRGKWPGEALTRRKEETHLPEAAHTVQVDRDRLQRRDKTGQETTTAGSHTWG